jgi:hypothetical protein
MYNKSTFCIVVLAYMLYFFSFMKKNSTLKSSQVLVRIHSMTEALRSTFAGSHDIPGTYHPYLQSAILKSAICNQKKSSIGDHSIYYLPSKKIIHRKSFNLLSTKKKEPSLQSGSNIIYSLLLYPNRTKNNSCCHYFSKNH